MDTRRSFNPFPGLRPFESSEAHLFFGRESQSVELLRVLRQHRFVAVVGSSGSGKSSLVRAGLLPSLHGGFMRSAGSGWRVAVLRPGANPIGNLARAIAEPDMLGDGELDEQDRLEFMEITLRRGSLGLAEAVSEARLAAGENLLVVVDQFEELFRFQRVSTPTEFRDDAAAFVKLLLEASSANGVPCYVLLTMRSDYLGDCTQFRDLPEAINRGLYLIPRMTRDERRSAIAGPVAVEGGDIAPRLVNRILNDVGDEPDQLPILQHALMRAWDFLHADGADGRLDLSHYEAVGGASEALSRHAEEAYAELDPSGQALAEKVFRRLTERGPDNRDIRRPTRFSELCAIVNAAPDRVAAVLDVFRQPGRSFFMPSTEVALEPGTLVDISHESLIRGWERLRQWVADEAESARQFRRLADSALLWEAGRAGLLVDPELSHVLSWWDRERPQEAWAKAYHPGYAAARTFLERSREERDHALLQERQREIDRRRLHLVVTAGVTLALVLATAGFASAWWARGNSLETEKRAREELADTVREVQRAREELDKRVNELTEARKALDDTVAEMRRAREREQSALGQAQENARVAKEQARVAEEALLTAEAANLQVGRMVIRNESDWLRGQYDLSAAQASARQGAGLASVTSLFAQEARRVARMGLQDSAVAGYTNALQLNPQDPAVLMNRSVAYLNLNNPDGMRADLEVLLELDPNDFLTRLNLGIAHMLAGDYEWAARSLRESIEATRYGVESGVQPEASEEIRAATGYPSLHLARGEVRAGLRLALASTIALNPRTSPSFADSLNAVDREETPSLNAILNPLNWLWLTRRQQHWSEVRDYGLFAAEGALWERAGWGPSLRGTEPFRNAAVRSFCRFRRLHAEQGNGGYDDLAAWVDSRLAATASSRCPGNLDAPAISEDLEDVEALMSRAEIQEARDSLRSAEGLYGLALQTSATGQTYTAERPHLFLDRGKVRISLAIEAEDSGAARRYLRAARSDADSALALQPQLAEAYFLRGRARYMMADRGDEREINAVLADLDTALAYQPTMILALLFRAWTLEELYPREAAATMRQALALSPARSQSWIELAHMELRNGEYPAAEEAASVALRLDPDLFQPYVIVEAARQRLPADSMDSPRVWLPLGRLFSAKVDAFLQVEEHLRAERFAAAALVAFSEAEARQAELGTEVLLNAGRRWRCLQRLNHNDLRKRLRDPLAGIPISDEALTVVRRTLGQVDENFDAATSCIATFTTAGTGEVP